MFYPTDTTHFLATAGTARTAMHQHGQWRTMACAFFCTIAIQHQYSSVMRGGTYHKYLCATVSLAVTIVEHKEPFPFLTERNRFINVFIWHDGTHRTEASTSCTTSFAKDLHSAIRRGDRKHLVWHLHLSLPHYQVNHI